MLEECVRTIAEQILQANPAEKEVVEVKAESVEVSADGNQNTAESSSAETKPAETNAPNQNEIMDCTDEA
jgi:hypothetical protein